MRTDRLIKLAKLLDTVPEKKFDIEYWGRYDKADAPHKLDISECGTTACAVGWACSIPEFREAGLCLEQTGTGFYASYFPKFTTRSMTVPMGQVTYIGYTAAAKFFEITDNEAQWLFGPEYYCPADADVEEWSAAESVKPTDVAARIRALMRGDGPDMGAL